MPSSRPEDVLRWMLKNEHFDRPPSVDRLAQLGRDATDRVSSVLGETREFCEFLGDMAIAAAAGHLALTAPFSGRPHPLLE